MLTSLAIIGVGKMGGAYAFRLSAAFPSLRLALCDANGANMTDLSAAVMTADANEAVGQADVVLLAVKPQAFDAVAASLSVPLEGKLVISIMAGVPLGKLCGELRTQSVIRSMPNLGVQVGHGMTAWVAGPGVSSAQKDLARHLFNATGSETELDDESSIDAFTALAGSGPAYFFYLGELLQNEAIRKGFSAEASALMAREVLIASGLLMQQGHMTPQQWKEAVASKGGTTEAALRSFEGDDLARLVARAVEAAENRSRSLGA